MVRKCCVPGCKARVVWFKVFPHPVKDKYQRFKLWLDAIGSAQLKSMDPIRVYQTKNICHDHFANDCYISDPSFRRLKDTCIPNKNLPASDVLRPLAKLFASFQGEEMRNVISDQQAEGSQEAGLMSCQSSLHNGQSHNISTDSSEGGVIDKRYLENTQTIQAAATPTDNDDWSNISCPEVEVVAQEILVEDVPNDCSLGQCGEENSFKLNDNIKNVTNSNQKSDLVSDNNNSTTDQEATIKTYERSHKKVSETIKKTAITTIPPIKSKLIKPKLIYTVIDLN